MSMNETPSGERVHIGFFGRRNAGKSSVVNAVTGQEISVVSEIGGTTTDPVAKSMELLPMGPVVIIDTPGFDDEGALGQKRVRRARQVLNRIDVAVLTVDATEGIRDCDRDLISLFDEKDIPYIIVYNKSDLLNDRSEERVRADKISEDPHAVYVSALTGEGIYELKEKIAHTQDSTEREQPLIGDLIRPSDVVLLVIPIDKAAPKGRLILPQQMMIRGILDADGIPVCVREDRLTEILERLRKMPYAEEAGQSAQSITDCGEKEKVKPVTPALVITDSQAFERVAAEVPQEIPITSFSILMARYKGFLKTAYEGAAAIDRLRDGDTVLISEGCTHHRQCGDIGTVKLPHWLTERTGKKLSFETSSGRSFPEDLGKYAMIIHCGGCMLNRREIMYRMKCARDQGVPITNYGTAIAFMKGILERSTQILREQLQNDE